MEQKEVIRQQEEVIIPDRSVLWDYIAAAGNICIVGFLIFIIFMAQSLASGADFFASWW